MARNAIFQAAGSACIRRDISSDGGFLQAGWVGRIEEVSAGCSGGELGSDDAWLNDGDAVLGRDFKNPVHFDKRENQAAPDWYASSDITPTAPPGGNWDPMTIRIGEDFGDLGGIPRKRDCFWKT
jgi:hypothetical protein